MFPACQGHQKKPQSGTAAPQCGSPGERKASNRTAPRFGEPTKRVSYLPGAPKGAAVWDRRTPVRLSGRTKSIEQDRPPIRRACEERFLLAPGSPKGAALECGGPIPATGEKRGNCFSGCSLPWFASPEWVQTFPAFGEVNLFPPPEPVSLRASG